MTAQANPSNGGGRGMRWRSVVWGGAATLLAVPWLAMQFTREVNWTGFDFVVFGAMLTAACIAFEIAARMSRDPVYRIAAGIAVATGFLLVWVNLAVGMIGSENDLANLMYAGVLAIGPVGALVSRGRARGMALTLAVMAAAQVITGAIGMWISQAGVFAADLVFAAAWLASAAAFRAAAARGA